MIEFFKNNYFIPIYGVALVIAIFRYRWYYESVLKYFPMLIAYALLSEILGYFILNFESFQIIYSDKYYYANNFIFNIYDVIFFLYFYFLYWRIITNSKYKNIIKYGAILYLISSIINPFFENVLIFPQIYASTVGSLVLIISTLFYFGQIKQYKENKKNLLLWVSTGLLIYNIFFPIVMLTGRYNYYLYQELYFRQIHHFLIAVMYSCFIIGFLKMKRMKPVREEN